MLYAISLFPILIYIALIRAMDAISLTRWDRGIVSFVWGAAVCGALFFVSVHYPLPTNGLLAVFVEETLKGIPMVVSIYRKRTAFFVEALIYGAAIGAGFAAVENVLYVGLNEYFAVGDSVFRGCGTSLLHMGCTALLTCSVLVGARLGRNRHVATRVALTLVAFLPSNAIHFCHNMLLEERMLPEVAVVGGVVLVMFLLFLVVGLIDERLIHKWLDVCIANDVQLFAAIRNGQLGSTKAGEYLIQMREKFSPEKFFDILVFLQLYLEISIAAKSLMIMREAGMDQPVPEAEHDAYMDKTTELNHLSRAIGKSGMQVLSPIVNIKAVDIWTIEKLL